MPATGVEGIPATGDELMAALADGLSYDRQSLSPAQLASAPGRWSAGEYARRFASLPESLRASMVDAWGPPPGDVYVEGDELVFSGLDLGNVLVLVQPPRGFGDHPVAVYHSPDLPPTHHYVAFYRWLDEVWGADAVVHVGKHGTLEWLPGQGSGPVGGLLRPTPRWATSRSSTPSSSTIRARAPRPSGVRTR